MSFYFRIAQELVAISEMNESSNSPYRVSPIETTPDPMILNRLNLAIQSRQSLFVGVLSGNIPDTRPIGDLVGLFWVLYDKV